ncbi:MAG: YbaN family protein [Mariprofundaceae bacterium]
MNDLARNGMNDDTQNLHREQDHAHLILKNSPLGTGIRALLIVVGTLSVICGIIGIVLPLVPTVPFLLLAAACYARSSEKCYRWLLNHKWFGEHIYNYRAGKGIPLKGKVTMIGLIWLTIGFTAAFMIDIAWVQIMLVCIATGVTAQLCYLPTLKQEKQARN